MPLSMHQASVPVFTRQLEALAAILKKAGAHAEARKIDFSVFVNDRLAPDMHPLSRQIQIASDSAKGAVARLAGVAPPSFPDTETTLVELQDRIARTITFIQGVPADQIDAGDTRTITLEVGGADVRFPGPVFLLNFVLPNFFFHVTMAYAILRHNGVEIGKRDFLGAP